MECCENGTWFFPSIGLYHALGGITNPKYKLSHFLATKQIYKELVLAFNRDRCCHLVLCLWLILFQWLQQSSNKTSFKWQRLLNCRNIHAMIFTEELESIHGKLESFRAMNAFVNKSETHQITYPQTTKRFIQPNSKDFLRLFLKLMAI
jgi:hypothetical protein